MAGSPLIGQIIARLGMDTRGMEAGELRARASLRRVGDEAKRSFGTIGAAVITANQAMQLLRLGIDTASRAFQSAIGPAIAYESAFAGVRKTVNASEAEFRRLDQVVTQMSRRLPVAATEIADVFAVGGQLGIKTANLEKFADTVIKLGVATNLSSQEAAQSLAKLANITQLPQDQFDRLGSTIVALGNNLATTERDIVAMSLRIAGAGKQVGLTEAQILGFAGALSSVGIEAEAGGSAISRIFVDIAKAVKTGNSDLATFAQITGQSTAAFKESFERDATGAVLDFVRGLDLVSKSGGNVFGLLERLGLDNIRVSQALFGAANSGDLFRRSIELGTQAFRENIALNKEASQRFATTESNLKLLGNAFVAVARESGRSVTESATFAGGLGALSTRLNEVADDVAHWVAANRTLIDQRLDEVLDRVLEAMSAENVAAVGEAAKHFASIGAAFVTIGSNATAALSPLNSVLGIVKELAEFLARHPGAAGLILGAAAGAATPIPGGALIGGLAGGIGGVTTNPLPRGGRVARRLTDLSDEEFQKGLRQTVEVRGARSLPPGFAVGQSTEAGPAVSFVPDISAQAATAARRDGEIADNARKINIETNAAISAKLAGESNLLDAQAETLEKIAALDERRLASADLLNLTQEEQLALIEHAKRAQLDAIALRREAVNKEISAQGILEKSTDTTTESEKQRATATGQIKVLKEQLKQLDLEEKSIAESNLQTVLQTKNAFAQLASERARVATARAETAAGKAAFAFDVAQSKSAPRGELLALAQAADQAQADVIRAQRAEVEARLQAAVAQGKDKTDAGRIEIDAMTAEVAQFTAQLDQVGDRVRGLGDEFINLGDVLSSTLTDVVQGIALGTGKFEDAGKRVGQAFIGSLISEVIKDKVGKLDLRLKKNFLSDIPGFASQGGTNTGNSFIGGLVDSVFGGSGGTFFNASAGATGGAAQASRLSGIGLDAAAVSQVQAALATNTTGGAVAGSTGAASAGGVGGLGAAAGYAAIVLAAIGAITGSAKAAERERKKLDLLDSQSRKPATDESVQREAIVGAVEGSLGIFGLDAIGGPLGNITRNAPPELRNAFFSPGHISAGVVGSLAGLAFGIEGALLGAYFGGSKYGDAINKAIGLRAPTLEHQIGRSLDKLFEKASVPRIAQFKDEVLNRDLETLRARSSGSPVVRKVLAGNPASEELADSLTSVGQLIVGADNGANALFARTFINNARALGLSASEARDEFKKIAESVNLDFVTGVNELNRQMYYGGLSAQHYADTIAALADVFSGDIIGGAEAVARALVEVSETGRASANDLQDALKVATDFVGGVQSSVLDILLGGGSTRDAALAAGGIAAKSFKDEFLKEAILSPAQAEFLAAGITDIGSAAKAAAAGDKDESRRLIAQGAGEIKQGALLFADFVKELVPTFKDLDKALGLDRPFRGGLVDHGGLLNQPSFDVGGIVPGAFGAPVSITAHGGEPIIPLGQSQDFLTMLHKFTSGDAGGGPININLTIQPQVDGRAYGPSQRRNITLQRDGTVVADTGIGVRA